MKKLTLFIYFIFSCIFYANAQNRVVFSSIKGKLSKPQTITINVKKRGVIADFKLGGSQPKSFAILSAKNDGHKNNGIILQYAPAADFVGIENATLFVYNAAGKTIQAVDLTGLSTNGLEGENEPPLARLISALGYKINPGWASLANNVKPALQGEEISASLFIKTSAAKVEILPLARYSPDFALPFGYYINTGQQPLKYEVGSLAKSDQYPEHQTIYPALASGSASFDPGSASFGFYATSPTHSAYSEDAWNISLHPAHAVHATRIYPVKDKAGKLIKNTYLVCFEEAKNGDYNDYVFLVKNIKPLGGK